MSLIDIDHIKHVYTRSKLDKLKVKIKIISVLIGLPFYYITRFITSDPIILSSSVILTFIVLGVIVISFVVIDSVGYLLIKRTFDAIDKGERVKFVSDYVDKEIAGQKRSIQYCKNNIVESDQTMKLYETNIKSLEFYKETLF